MKVNYKAIKFTRCIYGRKLFGNKTLEFSQNELLYSAIMVGKGSYFDYLKLGLSYEYEIYYRIMFLETLIFENSSNYLEKTIAYSEGFDPTEKGFASYYIGNVFSKLVASKLLNIKQLVHFDLYKNSLCINTIGERRPDFIGKNARGEWILAESKGRSKNYDDRATLSGKDQLNTIYSIDNKKPVLKYVVQTYFKSNILNLHIEDPEGNEGEIKRINLNEFLFEKSYYNLVIRVLYENRKTVKVIKVENSMYYYTYLEKVKIAIGLKREIYDKYREYKLEINDNFKSHILDFSNKNYYIAKDGVFIFSKIKMFSKAK